MRLQRGAKGAVVVLEFDISVDDLVSFLNVHQAARPSYRRLVMAGRFGGALLILGVPFLLPVPLLVQAITGGVVAALWLVFLPKILAASTARMVRQMYGEGRNRGIVGWHRLTLSPEGLREACETGESVVRLEGIERIAETATHAFVYLGAVQGFVIPKAGVKGDLEAFLAALASKGIPRVAA